MQQRQAGATPPSELACRANQFARFAPSPRFQLPDGQLKPPARKNKVCERTQGHHRFVAVRRKYSSFVFAEIVIW
jgi:hypothetical protein